MNAETAMHARTRKTHEDAQLGRGLVHCVLAAVAGSGVYTRGEKAVAYPLRTRRIAIHALVVVVCLLYLQQLHVQD